MLVQVEALVDREVRLALVASLTLTAVKQVKADEDYSVAVTELGIGQLVSLHAVQGQNCALRCIVVCCAPASPEDEVRTSDQAL